MRVRFLFIVAIVLTPLLSGCNSSSDRDDIPEELTREIIINSQAPNDSNGNLTTAITASLFLPDEHRNGQAYPLIIHSHSWGGSRVSSSELRNMVPATAASTSDYGSQVNSQLAALREAGYAIISFDQRGFGRNGDDGDNGSEGGSHGMSPDFEIEDAKAVVQWAVDEWQAGRLNLLADGDDPRIGLLGSSYGGAFQPMLAAEDPRIDAIVPSMTWHNLEASFAPNGVLKKAWLIAICNKVVDEDGAELSTEMELACTQVRLDDSREIEDARVTENLFFDNSLASYEADPTFRMPKVDALILQGVRDTLFPMNEALKMRRYLLSGGGDVKIIAHESGHSGVRSGAGSQGPIGQAYCGSIDAITTIRRWFDEKLYRRNSVALPDICVALDNRTGIRVSSIAPASGSYRVAIPPSTTLQGISENNVRSAANEALFYPLGQPITQSNLILLGTPLARVTVNAGVTNDDPTPATGPNAAGIFIGVGILRNNQIYLVDDQVQPILSTDPRTDGTQQPIELVAVAEKLEVGDRVGVLLYGKHDLYENHPIGSNELGTNWDGNVATVFGTVDLPIIEANSLDRR
ncbi:ABC-2 type transport system ATP-binding protein [Litorivivens lipolytica]|uniref:ABC-2 type transport system ATP-binding protein n=1 Tax=Litorivivens lipolytica TaxID=1524264 RepID=A0A7W4W543_9GAMM|nr:alpha/beta fold hydrolase [Litorivivens lipolytica]MBB3047293.1 ABC-2 type transport system ATP-binding protein [Litorivivens lipolytica]